MVKSGAFPRIGNRMLGNRMEDTHMDTLKMPGASWLILLLAILAAMLVPVPRAYVPQDRIFRVDASQFSFDPGVLAVKPGDRVTVELRSTDVVHGLYLDGYGLSVVADPGQTATLTFVADRPGSFRFRCSVPCGDIHPFMLGRLRVGPNWLLIRAMAVIAIVVVWSLVTRVKIHARTEVVIA
jgi:heme/copper-type cytochrome/quinol oxidase subunit 2